MPVAVVALAAQPVQPVQAAHRQRVRAAGGEGRLHRGEVAGEHLDQLAAVAHPDADHLGAGLEQRLQLMHGGVGRALAVVRADVLVAAPRRVPVADGQLEAVDLVDVVAVGDVDDVAQHAVLRPRAVDGQLEARHAEARDRGAGRFAREGQVFVGVHDSLASMGQP
ncbi:hypothetical protein D3C72_1761000 [compost metagenome]